MPISNTNFQNKNSLAFNNYTEKKRNPSNEKTGIHLSENKRNKSKSKDKKQKKEFNYKSYKKEERIKSKDSKS